MHDPLGNLKRSALAVSPALVANCVYIAGFHSQYQYNLPVHCSSVSLSFLLILYGDASSFPSRNQRGLWMAIIQHF